VRAINKVLKKAMNVWGLQYFFDVCWSTVYIRVELYDSRARWLKVADGLRDNYEFEKPLFQVNPTVLDLNRCLKEQNRS